jgi:glycosyltransferase involved in cell wall biosynthesis
MTAAELPRLLYVAEVPVEASFHGSALIHRLLSGFPANKLCVVETGLEESQPSRRLQGPVYHYLTPELTRLQNRHLSALRFNAVMFRAAATPRRRLLEIARQFAPQAILTVSHGPSWLEAGVLAERLSIPCHLICHDDWLSTMGLSGWMGRYAERQFSRAYQASASRFCVSPYMAERYETLYGVPGTVLYPSRAADMPAATAPPAHLAEAASPFTIAFAGSPHASYAKAFQLIADALAKVQGRLLLFGPPHLAGLRDHGLTASNIEFRGLLPSADLVRTLREHALALLAPMSFEAADRATVTFGFPSKLTDYTAAGLPLILQGPDYCSAMIWARRNPGVAQLITSNDPGEVQAAVQALAADGGCRLRLARAAIEAGNRYFGAEAATRTFYDQIATGHMAAPARAG